MKRHVALISICSFLCSSGVSVWEDDVLSRPSKAEFEVLHLERASLPKTLTDDVEKTPLGGICLQRCVSWPRSPSGYYEIPFTLDRSYKSSTVQKIRWVMSYIESGSLIRFVPRTYESRFLRIENSDQCASHVGMVADPSGQLLKLSEPTCIYEGIILHELSHSLGIDHEHQRPDRNNYLTIFPENVKDGSLNQLSIVPYLDSGSITRYDYASIMHYDMSTFAKNRNDHTLEPHDHNYNAMLFGKKFLYSSCDWYELQYLYPARPIIGPSVPAIPCNPHVAGRGLTPTRKCYNWFEQSQCEIACLLDPQIFFDKGYCEIDGTEALPPPPWKLPLLATGSDADHDFVIYGLLQHMRRAVGDSSKVKPKLILSLLILGSALFTLL